MYYYRSKFHQLPKAWDREADILIIGSGIAGFAAADASAKPGNKIIIFEKMPYLGGNSNLAGGGYSCWDSKLKLRQRLGLGEDSWERHKEDTLNGGNSWNIPELVETMVKNAPEGLDWLVDAGVPFKNILVKVGCHTAYRTYQMDVTGKQMMNLISRKVIEKGVKLELNRKITAIFRDGEDGEVAGLEVHHQDGIERVFARKAILIASGGFSNDLRLRTAHRPDLTELYNCSNQKGATGEVIRYAQAIGADTLHMASIQLFPCADPKTGSVDRWAFYSYSGAGFGVIYVDGSGKRFINELAGRDEISSVQIAAKEKPTYCILNLEICNRLAMTERELKNGLRNKRMISGGTIEALEEALQMPKGNLVQTVCAHNDALKRKHDPEFGKPMDDFMSGLEEGPFYAIPIWPCVHYTHGGIRINVNANVIDIFGNPIPRLYGAGEVCGGVHGSNRLGGHGIAECIVFGRIAGKMMGKETRRAKP